MRQLHMSDKLSLLGIIGILAILGTAATLSQILQPSIAQTCEILCKNHGYIVSSEAQTHDDAVGFLKEAPGWDPNQLKESGQEHGDSTSDLATGKIIGPD